MRTHLKTVQKFFAVLNCKPGKRSIHMGWNKQQLFVSPNMKLALRQVKQEVGENVEKVDHHLNNRVDSGSAGLDIEKLEKVKSFAI